MTVTLGPRLLLEAEDAHVVLAGAVVARRAVDPAAAAHLFAFGVVRERGGGTLVLMLSCLLYPLRQSAVPTVSIAEAPPTPGQPFAGCIR